MCEFHCQRLAEQHQYWERRGPGETHRDDDCRGVQGHRPDPHLAVCGAVPTRLPTALLPVFGERTILAVRSVGVPVARACTSQSRLLAADTSPNQAGSTSAACDACTRATPDELHDDVHWARRLLVQT